MSEILQSYQENEENSMLWIFRTDSFETYDGTIEDETQESREDQEETTSSLVIRPINTESLSDFLQNSKSSRGKGKKQGNGAKKSRVSSPSPRVTSNHSPPDTSKPHPGMLCVLGEGSRDHLNQMKVAVEKSIAMTNGKRKVTEITPHSIPESLTAHYLHYLEKNEGESTLRDYKLALKGVRTFVPRENVGGNIMHAFLVQGQFEVGQTLRTAVAFRPFLNGIQYYSIANVAHDAPVEERDTLNDISSYDDDILLQERESQEANLRTPTNYMHNNLKHDQKLEPIEEMSTEEESIDTDSNRKVEKTINIENSVIFVEPETVKKGRRKKRVKVKQTKRVQGLSKPGSALKAVEGDKSCENCTIM